MVGRVDPILLGGISLVHGANQWQKEGNLSGLGHKPLRVENPNAIAGLGEHKQSLATGIDIRLGLNADSRHGSVDFILDILREKGAKPIQVSDEVFDILHTEADLGLHRQHMILINHQHIDL